MERQQLFTLKVTDDALATLNTLANIRRWRKGKFIPGFRLERWNTLLFGFHGNRLVLRSPWQPFASILATAFHSPHLYRSPSDLGLGMLLRSSDEKNNVREADDAGGRTADERLHQTLLRSPQKMPNSRRQLCRALDTLACFGRWRTLTIYLGISLCDGRLDVVLICHRFGQIWNRSAADVRLPLLADSAPLSALSPSPLRPARP